MSSFIQTIHNTTSACWDAYELPEQNDYSLWARVVSIAKTAIDAAITLPSHPCKGPCIVTLVAGSMCFQCTDHTRSVEKAMKITRIALVAYSAIFGSNAQRSAIAMVVAVVALNHFGYVPKKLRYAYYRYDHFADFALNCVDACLDDGSLLINLLIGVPVMLRAERLKQNIRRSQRRQYFQPAWHQLARIPNLSLSQAAAAA